MFWTLPISKRPVVTNTPLGVRSITHVFFEDKNGGIFNYRRGGLQSVSISIDGKQVCNSVPIVPFCTTSPYGQNRFEWGLVALEVGLNVDMSEVKISAAEASDDFNVVFVTSDKEVDGTRGFEYVECRRFNLRQVLSYEEALEIAQARLTDAKTAYAERLAEGRSIEIRLTAGKTRRYPMVGSDSQWIEAAAAIIADDSITSFNVEDGVEHTLTFDRAPEKVLAVQYMSLRNASSDFNPERSVLISSDAPIVFTLTGEGREPMPANTDLVAIQAGDGVPMRKAVYEMEDGTASKTMRFTYVTNAKKLGWGLISRKCPVKELVGTWDLFLLFIYRKLI